MSNPFTDSTDETPPECFLRILSGPHLGVCVPLTQGDYLIGGGLDSDFVISDDLISDQHATLHVTQGNVTLLSENGGESTWLDGEAVTGEKFPLVPEKVFTLGRTHFALTEKGDAEGSQIDLPTIAWPDNETEASEDDETEIDDEDEAILEPDLGDPNNPIADSVSASDFHLKNRQPKKKSKTGCVITSLILFALLGGIFYFLGLFLGLFSPSTIPTTDTDTANLTPQQKLEAALKKYPEETGVSLEKNDTAETISVNGLVTTNEVRTALMRDIRAAVPTARIKLTSIPSTENGIRGLLNQIGAGQLKSKLSVDGTLALSGQFGDSNEIPRITDQLARNFPPIKQFDTDSVWTRDNLIVKLTAITKEAGLDDFLSYALDGANLVVGGALAEEKRADFDKLKAELKNEFEPTLTLVDEVEIFEKIPESLRVVQEDPNAPAEDPGPNPNKGPEEVPVAEKVGIAGFQNVTVGPISWVVTSKGEKLLEGATLPSGFVVEKITRDYVQLRKEEIIETIYLK